MNETRDKNPLKFWEELKRRKVVRVIIAYLASAYVILELTTMIVEPLGLPGWTTRLVIIILCFGFIVITIISWIYDLTPGGIVKTEATNTSKKDQLPATTKFSVKGSDIIIVGLLIAVVILAYPKIFKKDIFYDVRDDEGRISVAVMPFKNLTTDTLYNIWQQGFQDLLITSLSNSKEISVRYAQPINNIIGKNTQNNYASLTPSFASEVAFKLEAKTVILGNLYKSGDKIRVTTNIINSSTEDLYKSFEVSGDAEDDIFNITDSLSGLILNFLEIKSIEGKMPAELTNVFTTSVEAYKHYLNGRNYHGNLKLTLAIEEYNNALTHDSTFVLPMLYLTYIYMDRGQTDQCRRWAYEAYSLINELPPDIQLEVHELKAMVDKKPREQLKFVDQYLILNPYSTQQLYTKGWINYNLNNWQVAIEALEKGIKLNEALGNNYKLWVYYYTVLGNAYNKTGDSRKAFKTFEDGMKIWPDNPIIAYNQVICAISTGDTNLIENYVSNFESVSEKNGLSEKDLIWWLASCYEKGNEIEKAEEYYRYALRLDKNDPGLINEFAYFLISDDIDLDEGLELIQQVLKAYPDSWNLLYTYGLGLYKKGSLKEAFKVLKKSWDLRPSYDHEQNLIIREIEQELAK